MPFPAFLSRFLCTKLNEKKILGMLIKQNPNRKIYLFFFIYLFNSPKIHYTDKKNGNIYKGGARNLLETIGLFN